MGNIASQFATAFRDFVTDGIASSGAHDPIKAEVRAIGPLIEAALGAVSLASVDVIKETRAALNSDLAWAADTVALVYGDATDANNDLYIKVGASGSGSWTLTTILHDAIGGVVAAKVAELVDPKVEAAETAEANAETAQAAAEAAAVTAGTARDEAVAAAEDAAAAAKQAGNRSYFGSAMFPIENGRTTDLRKNGRFLVPGFRTAAGGTGAATDFWRNAYSCLFFVDPHRTRVDAQNFFPYVLGTSSSQTANRSFGCLYYPLNNSSASLRQRFRFWVRGESGPGTWTMDSAVIPTSARGPFALLPYNDGANGYLDVLDLATGTWYDGAASAKPGSWIGVSTVAFNNDLAIGTVGSAAFPADNSASPQAAVQWRGSIGDLLFCNAALTRADVEAIADGADPVSTATARGATVHCHIPLASGGELVDTVNTSFTGITLTQGGVILPGATMRRQGESNWITLDKFNAGEIFPVELNRDDGTIKLAGGVGGLTGRLMARVVLANGQIWQDWTDTKIPVLGGVYSGSITTKEFRGRAQVLTAMSSDLTVVACSHVDNICGPKPEFHAQSEGVFATTQGRINTGAAGGLNVTLPDNADTIQFAVYLDHTLDQYAIISSEDAANFLGDGCAAIINYIRARTDRSMMIVANAISGTSPLALMNDADTSRNWADLEGLRNLTSARGPNGETITTGHVIFGWEADISVPNVMAAAHIPLIQGTASGTIYNAAQSIPQADIDHFLYDGSASMSAKVVISPANRSTVAAGSATATDAGTKGDTRDHMRNYAHLIGYDVAPEALAHKIQGENAAGGALVAGTHPEPQDWEGSVEHGITAAEAIMMACGMGSYPGPVFFESVKAGSAANKVVVTVGDPRPYPGLGLASGATGYSTAAQIVARSPINLHTKKAGGNPGSGFEARIKPSGGSFGAWSKLNVTSGVIINPRAVELTLSSSLSAGDEVQIRYLPGGGGNYSTATITQEAWRSGLLYFTGQELAGGEPNSVDDMVRLGWQVAGSNQALTFIAS